VLAIQAGADGVWAVPAAAFAGALLAVSAVYRLARVAGGVLDSRILLLGGVVVGAFAGGLTCGILAFSDVTGAGTAMLWLLGVLGRRLDEVAVLTIAAPAPPFWRRRAPSILALGEEPANTSRASRR
jgi:iron complex transport system permease protein